MARRAGGPAACSASPRGGCAPRRMALLDLWRRQGA
jgi:hypothetical protein